MTKIETLQKQLIDLGASEEEVKGITDKDAAKEWISTLKALENATGTEKTEADSATNEKQEEVREVVPSYYSPEWESYALSKFTKEELAEGKYPKINGLRRVAPLLLGDILSSKPIKVESNLSPDNPGRAYAVYEVIFLWKVGMEGLGLSYNDLPKIVFGGTGGSYIDNTDDAFCVYPESIAETRAEARALRKALRISVVSYDEITKKDTGLLARSTMPERSVNPIAGESKTITQVQITAINNMCKKLNIDVEKFINMGERKYDSINDIPYDKSLLMIRQLNAYQSNGDESKIIPSSILLV